MARGKSPSGKKAKSAGQSEPVEDVSTQTDSTSPSFPTTTALSGAAADVTNIPADIVRMKEAFTAPFMKYDAETRRIVSNPAYNRTLLTEVRRLQSIALSKLRTPLRAHLSYTPKELLYELEATLYCMVASAAVGSNEEGIRYFTSDAEADAVMPQLETFLAQHTAPAKAAVAVAYCLTEGTSHDVLTKFVTLLTERVEQELDPAIHQKRTEAEQKALRATKNNVQDMAQLLRDVATAYHSIDTPSQRARQQPQSDPTLVDAARSPAANAIPAQMIEEAYYKVLRWVLAVDTDRRALKVAATLAGPSSAASAHADGGAKKTSAVDAAVAAAIASQGTAPAAVAVATTQGFAKVADYDPFTGQVTLERSTEAQRWGLLLNGKGLLVGLENDLRNSSEAGERLYDAVQQQSGEVGGLAIYEVNRRRIRPVHLSDEEWQSSQSDILTKLRKGLTQPTKTLHLSIEKRKQADLTSPQEVLYEVSYQGGENGVGQRCLLMLERASTSISWGLKLKYLKGAPAVLSDFSPSVRLSAGAKNFLFDMRGRVRVLRMNNKELAKLSAAELKDVVSGALVLTLNLQVTDANGEVPEGLEAPEESAAQRKDTTADPISNDGATKAEDNGGEEEEEEEGNAAEDETAAEIAEEAEPKAEQVPKGKGKKQVKASAAEMETDAENAKEAAVADTANFDEIAAAIADEFLLQEQQQQHLESPSKASTTTKKKKGLHAGKGEEAAAVDEVEPFEELDWAKPTTIFEAEDDAADDHDAIRESQHNADSTKKVSDGANENGDEAASPRLIDDNDEQAAAEALLQEHNLLPDHHEHGGDATSQGRLARDSAEDNDEAVEEEEKKLNVSDENEDNAEEDEADAEEHLTEAEKAEKAALDFERRSIDAAEMEGENEVELNKKLLNDIAYDNDDVGPASAKRGAKKLSAANKNKKAGKGKKKKAGKKAKAEGKTKGRKSTNAAEAEAEEEENEDGGKEEKDDDAAEPVSEKEQAELDYEERWMEAVEMNGEGDEELDEEALEDIAEGNYVEEGEKAEKQELAPRRSAKKLPTSKKGKKALKATKGKGKRRTRKSKEDANADAEEEENNADAEEPAEADDTAADADSSDKPKTSKKSIAADVADVPLVDLPRTTAEVAIAEGEKNAAKFKQKKGSRAAKTAMVAEEKAEAEAASPDAEEAEKGEETAAEPQKKEKRGKKKAAIADTDDDKGSIEEKVEQTTTASEKNFEAPAVEELKPAASSLPASDAATSRVSLTELLNASPLTFENDVKLEKFDGSTLQLERNSVSSPWNIKVAFAGDDIIMTKLPPIPAGQRSHPYLRSLGAGQQGEVKWVVEALNGQDLSLMSKPLKTKALDAIKGSTKLSFVLKALRK